MYPGPADSVSRILSWRQSPQGTWTMPPEPPSLVPPPEPLPLPPLFPEFWGAALLGATEADGRGVAFEGAGVELPCPFELPESLGTALGEFVPASEPLPDSVGAGVGVALPDSPLSEPMVVVADELWPVRAEIGFCVIASIPVMTPMAMAKTSAAAPMSAGHLRPRRDPIVSQPRRHQLLDCSASVLPAAAVVAVVEAVLAAGSRA